MCRYAYKIYKQRFACFVCRKAFKRRYRDDLTPAMVRSGRHNESVRCPQCRGVMHDMGQDFEAPRQSDLKQWKKVRVLFEHGFTFHSCGCGPGLRPAELREVGAFLEDSLRETEVRKLLTTIAARRRERDRQNRERPPRVAREATGRTWGREVTPFRRALGRRRPTGARRRRCSKARRASGGRRGPARNDADFDFAC